MEILTEFDGLQDALSKINMDESVMPYINGRLVDDGAWNKTQKILNCPEMISAHKYLYNLDMDQLTEEEIEKIDQLYKLGCDRGFIVDDLTDWDDAEKSDETKQEEIEDEVSDAKPIGGTLFKAKIPCWTVIYSATSKDGDIKTGEAYSNAISVSAAKADVNAKLSRIGYSNISILAIEATDACDCSNVKEYDDNSNKEVEENDMLNNRPHNAHIDASVSEAEAEDEEDGDKQDDEDSSNDDANEDSDESDDSQDDESSNEDEESSDEEAEDEDKDTSDEDASDEDTSDENEANSDEESSKDEDEDDEANSDDDSENQDNDEDTSDEDTSDEEDKDEESSDDDELDANQKAELKDKYRKTFKNVLVKCKFNTSFNDLTLDQKIKFFTELSKAWNKNEPNEFMTDKEIEQLNNIAVKENDED